MFDDIEDAKKRRILEAAFEQFAKNGYDFSTNAVAQIAEVSKGLIFFHFQNKKGIILALVDEVVKLTIKNLMSDYQSVPKDFFERLKYVIDIKYKMAVEMPLLYDFSWKITADAPKEPNLKNEVYDRMFKDSDEFNKKFLGEADYSAFRKDIDIKDAVNIAVYMLHGWSEANIAKESSKGVNMPVEVLYSYKKEGEHYIDVLKKILTYS